MMNYAIILAIALSIFFGVQSLSTAKETRFEVAGTIMDNGTGWKVLKDSQHEPINLSKISLTSNAIKIDHKVGAKSVVTFMVTTDETMTKDGYRVGVSAGLDFSYIYVYDKDGNPVNPKHYSNPKGNIWIYGILK